MNDTPEKAPKPPSKYETVEIDPAFIKSPAMSIWFDQALFDRARQIATYLSKAEGFVPPHLLGKLESCFAVVERSLSWKLSPFSVANACYQTPNGRVGFEGKLCQAALESSGKVEGAVQFEHIGDWEKIAGKFEIRTSSKSGKDYAVPTWTREEAVKLGLGVIVSAKMKGEAEPRRWTMYLSQCFPLNSTLWSTDPKTQICYTAVRRFANLAAPGIFMGVEFDREGNDEDSEMVRAARARDITPAAPAREQFTAPAADPTASAHGSPKPVDTKESEATPNPSSPTSGTSFQIVGVPDGDILYETDDGADFAEKILAEAKLVAKNVDLLNALWENNSAQFQNLPHDIGQRIRDEWPRVKPQGNLGV